MGAECSESDTQEPQDGCDAKGEVTSDKRHDSGLCVSLLPVSPATCSTSFEIDWTHWTPRERANLCFIQRDGRVLLIRKKRGLGAGKINGPGGKIEQGETALESAVRETQEEIGVTPLQIEERGVLHFQFVDGYSLLCTVFVAGDFAGEPVETDEATPMWFPCDELPLEEMWEDDRHWLPEALAGRCFNAWFVFEGDQMRTRRVEWR
jgi:8-oxo-dGTP diphosphatase